MHANGNALSPLLFFFLGFAPNFNNNFTIYMYCDIMINTSRWPLIEAFISEVRVNESSLSTSKSPCFYSLYNLLLYNSIVSAISRNPLELAECSAL
jgi:hypothetical protein